MGKFFAVISSVLAAAAAEAQLPIAAQYLGGAGLYNGAYGYGAGVAGYASPYAHALAGPVAHGVDARFAYGAPITALNAGPLTAGPVAAAPALAATAPIVGAQYAAAYTPALAAAPVAYAAAPAAYAAAPVAYAAAPIAAPIAGPVSSQFQAQDEFGNVAYGYQNINSAKQEQGNAYGGVTGSYTYADEAGVHTAAPVVDTQEVAEAKAAFFAAFEAEASRTKRSAQLGAFGPSAYAGLATGLLPAGPVAAAAYAAPAAAAPSREAILTTIKLNPGHAVFYRVD